MNKLTSLPPEIIRKPIGFLMISGGIEVNLFTEMRLILEAKFGKNSFDLNSLVFKTLLKKIYFRS